MSDKTDHSKKLQRDLELIISTGLLISRSTDLHALVQASTDAGLQLCGAEFGAFFYNVIDAAGESYQLYALSGVDREEFAKFPMPRNTAVFAPTFEGTGVVRSADITKDPRYGKNAPHQGMPEGHLPVRSYLAVPVRSQTGEVLGGLFYGHATPDVFQQGDEDLVATIAAQAAIAIENFRLREQLTHKIKDLEDAEAREDQDARHLAELAAIVESSDDAILSKDLNGQITSWNKAAERILGYTKDEIIGRSILTLIPEHMHSDEPVIISKIRAGERIEHFETVRVTKNGTLLQVSLSISPIHNKYGKIVGASKILRDITGKRRMEQSLLQAEKIAAASRMAATIAHEVNNPLEAVVNLLYLAKMNATDADQINYLQTAENEVTRVSHIARQTLGFYREHASARPVSLSKLAAETIRVYEPKCKSANIQIEGDLRSELEIILRQGEIMQVISNLVANAIYAMPEGGLLKIATRDYELSTGAGVEFTIEDTGIGIPAEQLPKIFEAFYTTRGAIGTGIGLFVAKQFVEGHGGNMEVSSSTGEESHGTRFTITLPLATPYANGQDV